MHGVTIDRSTELRNQTRCTRSVDPVRVYVACASDSKCLENEDRYTAVVFALGQKVYCTKSKLSAD